MIGDFLHSSIFVFQVKELVLNNCLHLPILVLQIHELIFIVQHTCRLKNGKLLSFAFQFVFFIHDVLFNGGVLHFEFDNVVRNELNLQYLLDCRSLLWLFL